VRTARERGALTLPLYQLVVDADAWLRAGADTDRPSVRCRLSVDRPVRFSMCARGQVWFSAHLELDGHRAAAAGPVALSLAVNGARRRRTWSIRLDSARRRSRSDIRQKWRVFLGRFSGEPIEVLLELERDGPPGAGPVAVVLDNPALQVVASLRTLLLRAARRCWHTLRRDGLLGVLSEVAAAVDAERGRELRYRYWIRRHRRPRPRPAASTPVIEVGDSPSMSFLLPVGADTSADAIGALLASAAAQRAPHWQLFAVLDGATGPDVREGLRRWARRDARVHLVDAADGRGAALNYAASIASGSFLALLDAEGELAPEALTAVGVALARSPRADVLYSDEDRVDARGRRHTPFFKPDWSPYYFRSYPYLGQFCTYRADLVRQVGGFRASPSGADDYDVLLRLVERAREVRHIPAVLWHRRCAPGGDPLPHTRTATADLSVLRQHLEGSGAALDVVPGLLPGTHRVRWRVQGAPVVSVIIPTRDRVHLLRRCLSGLRERTGYPNLDIVVVDNGSAEPETRAFLRTCGARVVRSEGPFNFSRLCNLGAGQARGDHLLLLNNDTEPMSPDWLTAMLELSARPDVGAVGAKLHYFDGRIQHVGIAVGINGTAAQIFRGAAADHPGYCGQALVVHECAAVTGACLMTRREVWESLGGFDEVFPENFNDVDYCLRVARLGYRVVFTPFARLLHHEFATRQYRPQPPESALFRQRWAGAIDPYYSRHLSLRHIDCSVRLAGLSAAPHSPRP
jgi:O-antigen biosynthesis protein